MSQHQPGGVPGIHPPGKSAPGLRVVTHNVNGLGSQDKTTALLQFYSAHNMHIICWQETKNNTKGRQHTEQADVWIRRAAEAGARQYTVYWCDNDKYHRYPMQPSQQATSQQRTRHIPYGGTAILIRSDLLQSKSITVDHIHTRDDGRMMAMNIAWRGHHFTLLNTYWPNDIGQQRQFLSDMRDTMTTVHRGTLWITGDFNHVPNPGVDRMVTQQQASTRSQEVHTHTLFQQQVSEPQSLVDAFRQKHPNARGMTRIPTQDTQAPSRLDRHYIPQSMVPHMEQCQVMHNFVMRGVDHLPVVVHVRPIAPSQPHGNGYRAVKVRFKGDAALETKVTQWLQEQWQQAQQLEGQEYLIWYQQFKGRYKDELIKTNAAYTQQQQQRYTEYLQSQQHIADVLVQMEQTADTVLRQQLLQQYRQLQARCTPQHTQQQQQQHQQGMHQGNTNPVDRAQPAITQTLQSGHKSTPIACIRLTGGAITDDATHMANVLNTHFAGISSKQPQDEGSVQQVLQAIQHQQSTGKATTMNADMASKAGDGSVTCEEVSKALTGVNPNSSAGPDGIPYTAWQVAPTVTAQVLSKLYTTMFAVSQTSQHFTHGRVTPIYKAGDTADVNNYRPITVLNTDYRVLSRVLAKRFNAAMKTHIHKHQTAFLSGRRIADNIFLLQILPEILQEHEQQGAIAFLDIAKAYDTVDRSFLVQVMRQQGASQGMIQWVELLFNNTTAVTMVNGYMSGTATWQAGVRQGCPVSPYLYLFIAEACRVWLSFHTELGITVPNFPERLVSAQFADDMQVFLTNCSDATVLCLQNCFRVFGFASGQRLSVPKSVLLRIGLLPPVADTPVQVQGMPIKVAAKALGVMFSNPQPQQSWPAVPQHITRQTSQLPPDVQQQQHHQQQWERRLLSAETAATKLAFLSESTSGRAHLVSAYSLSQVTYHAEFEDGVQSYVDRLFQHAAAVVDVGPFYKMRARRPGVRADMLTGAVKQGGFGLLPLRQHVLARHCKWSLDMISNLVAAPATQPTWVQLVAVALLHAVPALHPAKTALLACYCKPEDISKGVLSCLPSVHPGTAIPNDLVSQHYRLPHGLIRRALTAISELSEASYEAQRKQYQQQQQQQRSERCNTQHRQHQQQAIQTRQQPTRLSQVCFGPGIPVYSTAQIRSSLMTASDDSILRVVPTLGWPATPCFGVHQPCPVGLHKHVVHTVTDILSSDMQSLRQFLQRQYITSAFHLAHQPVPKQHQLTALAHRVLKTAIAVSGNDERFLEIVNRLLLRGVPGAGAGHVPNHKHHCACGFQFKDLNNITVQHMFWCCPVAQAVVHSLQQQLPQAMITSTHLWLLVTPHSDVDAATWAVVAISALHAMNVGRKRLFCLCKSSKNTRNAHSSNVLVQQAQQQAVQHLWKQIQTWVKQHGTGDKASTIQPSQQHPWIYTTTTEGTSGLQVRLPQLLQLDTADTGSDEDDEDGVYVDEDDV